ncbi:MAG: START domain-containing protein, partial [Thermodesulfobacteriota bacterium]
MTGRIGIFVLCGFLAAGFSWAGPEEGGWKKVKEAEGIQVFTRSLKGTVGDEFMAAGKVNAPLEVVKEVWLDFSSYPLWFGSCKEYRLIKVLSPEGHHYLVYYVAASPSWAVGVSDRDAVLDVRAEASPGKEGRVIILLKALKEPLVPLKPDQVRITDMSGRI